MKRDSKGRFASEKIKKPRDSKGRFTKIKLSKEQIAFAKAEFKEDNDFIF